MKIKEAIVNATKLIEYWNAKILMEYVLKVNANYIIAHGNENLSKEVEDEYFNYVNDMKKGEPLQYITNNQEFMGENFYVNENVLIPQPDTEVLVENTVKLVQGAFKNLNKIKILDLCTGSGAIAISIKRYLKLLNIDSDIYASDISKEALSVAKKNTENILENQKEIQFIQSDMFNDIKDKFDIIVSNPPYIESDTITKLPKDVQNEPTIALDGGKDGLKFYRIISQNINKFLNNKGYLLLEIGFNQGEEVRKMFNKSILLKDYSGNDRVIVWRNDN